MFKKILILSGVIIIAIMIVANLATAAEAISAEVTDMYSVPAEGAKVYPDSKVVYFFDFEISDLEKGKGAEIEISVKPTSSYMECEDVTETIEANGYAGLKAECDIVSWAAPYSFIGSPDFSIEIDGISVDFTSTHIGFTVNENVLAGGQDEFFATSFAILHHPNRVLNGLSREDGSIQRRPDKADIGYTEINLFQSAHDPSFNVYPEKNSGITDNFLSKVILNPCANRSNCSGGPCSHTYFSDLPLTAEIDGNLVEQTKVYFYNPSSSGDVQHLTELKSGPVYIGSLKIQLPGTYPALEFADASQEKENSYYLKNSAGVTVDANEFIKDGGTFTFPQSDFQSFAIRNGKSGNIKAELSGKIYKAAWQYREDTSQDNQLECPYTISYKCNCGKGGCSTCYHHYVAKKHYPVFKWFLVETQKSVDFGFSDTTTVDVFSSTAWIQTKGGNMGTNNVIALAGTDYNRFKYPDSEVFFQEPSKTSTLTAPKDYAPLDQYNADFMIFAKKPATRTGFNITEFSSKANWYYEIPSAIESVFSDDEKTEKYGFGLRGEEYDRDEFPRDYEEDLLDREIFGEVIDFSKDEIQAEMDKFGGISKSGDIFYITGDLDLRRGNIYYFPSGYTVHLSSPGRDLLLKGSSARLHAEGAVYIDGNIIYGSHEALNYLDIPNLRIDANEIIVAGNVEYIESQLHTGTFYSGESDIQLKILGDVIAEETHFQRNPTNIYNPNAMKVNPPSEMIIEDLRKFVIPAPGDTILRDSRYMWQQVNPLTGEVVEPY